MKHICVISVLMLLVTIALAGCAKDSAALTDLPVVKPPATSVLVLPNPGVAVPFGESRFVTKWTVLGPITFAATDFGGDPQTAATDKEFMPNEPALDGTQPPPANSKATWKTNDFKGADTPGMINLDAFHNAPEHAAVYAVAWVNCPQEIKDAKLLVGSDDYLKVWINGKLVHTYKTERRAGEPDQDVVSNITLNKGLNRVVVKCVDVVLDWNFFLRFATADSKAIGVKSE